MSTKEERLARTMATAAELQQIETAKQQTNLSMLQQACGDALEVLDEADVQCLYINIQRIAHDDNPNKIMQAYAKQWLVSTSNLVKGATSVMQQKAASEAPPPAPPPDEESGDE